MEEKKKRGRPKKEGSEEGTYRVWTFLIYPDSQPDDWLFQLRQLLVEGCVSPLHDKDVNGDESEKKAHRHVMLCFDGKKSYAQIKKISVDLMHGTVPQRVNSMRGMVRYMVHLDNPEKHQYDMDDIVPLCGFDVNGALDVSGARLRQCVRDMEFFVYEHNFTEYAEFSHYCLLNNTEWHTVLTERRSQHFKLLLASQRGIQKQREYIAEQCRQNNDFYEKIVRQKEEEIKRLKGLK